MNQSDKQNRSLQNSEIICDTDPLWEAIESDVHGVHENLCSTINELVEELQDGEALGTEIGDQRPAAIVPLLNKLQLSTEMDEYLIYLFNE